MVVTRSVCVCGMCVLVYAYLTDLYLRRMFVEYSDWNMYTQNHTYQQYTEIEGTYIG